MAVKFMTFRKYRAYMWNLELDQLAKYVRTTKQALGALAADYSDKIHQAAAESPDDAESIYYEMGREAIDLEREFPALNHAATFVAIYSYMEHQLVILCRSLQKRKKLGIAVDDIAGKGIDQ